jgi:hypothetical protein
MLQPLFEFLHLLKHRLVVFKGTGLAVQEEPSYSSVAVELVGGVKPPNDNAAVCVPQPAKPLCYCHIHRTSW